MKHSRARSPEAIEFARTQRANSNEFAATNWSWVRNRQICRQSFAASIRFLLTLEAVLRRIAR
jgi:hypothetical protein